MFAAISAFVHEGCALTSVDEYELDGKGELKEKTFKVSVNPPHVFTRLGERTEI